MDQFPTEARNPASTNLDELTALELVRLMNREDSRVIDVIETQAPLIARAIEVITERLRAGGRLIYVGAGTSGRLGVLDAAECPPTFSSPPEQVVGVIAGGHPALTRAVEGAEDHPEQAHEDLKGIQLNSRDVLVGIATSGRTPYVLGAMEYARKEGAFVIGLACNPESQIAALADLSIVPVVGPEVLSGSTRLKAGTATKLVLNMLSTGAMVRLGKTYSNLMVDLRATNSKLRARTNRIVRVFTGISVEDADALLARCGGELKTALVAHQGGISPEEARRRLETVDGQVGRALEASAPSPKEIDAGKAGFYIGIDGGGSHTVALLARVGPGESLVLGRGESGPSNIQAVGVAKALRSLEDAVTNAFTAANLRRVSVSSACLGLAGAGRPEDQRRILEWAQKFKLAEHIEVMTDAAILLAAGTPANWGLAVVAGTGSMVFGRSPDGRISRAGGWGHLLGDEGSAYALAVSALRAVARAGDGRSPETALTKSLLESLGVQTVQQLVPAIYGETRDRAALASLAPLVLETAAAGDAVAKQIMENAARELAETAVAVARKLDFGSVPIPLAFCGGLLLGSPDYRGKFLAFLEERGMNAEPIGLVEEPASGAIRLASQSRIAPV